ncbi:hypothetical protein [uncultured Nitrospira sp.]|uniref:hypothetical protein n=1 Tax=uncultured Nitrospira sp. TaxID=157176 RepID=UPI003140AB74
MSGKFDQKALVNHLFHLECGSVGTVHGETVDLPNKSIKTMSVKLNHLIVAAWGMEFSEIFVT